MTTEQINELVEGDEYFIKVAGFWLQGIGIFSSPQNRRDQGKFILVNLASCDIDCHKVSDVEDVVRHADPEELKELYAAKAEVQRLREGVEKALEMLNHKEDWPAKLQLNALLEAGEGTLEDAKKVEVQE